MMKKIILIGMVILLLPALVQAIPFKNLILIQTFTTPFYAGDTQAMIVSFDGINFRNFTVDINITENTNQYPVWMDDFYLDVSLNDRPMICDEEYNGSFHCKEGTPVFMRESENILTVNATPKPNLYPSTYNFTLTLNAEIGFKAEGTGCVWEEVERCYGWGRWQHCWTDRTRVCKPATLFTEEDKLKMEMEDKTIEWNIERYVYRRWFESYYGVSEEWKRFNAYVLWDTWVYGHGSEATFSGRVI